MNALETKVAARNATIANIMDALNALEAVQFADASFAVLQEVEGKEIWTEISVKSKAQDFDPFEVAEVWKEDTAAKAKVKAEKAKAKAAKIAADKTKREAKQAAESGE